MSATSRKLAEREAYREVPETCPFVDSALSNAEEAIKKQTGNLRDALIDAFERAIDAEEKVKDLTERVAELEQQISALESA